MVTGYHRVSSMPWSRFRRRLTAASSSEILAANLSVELPQKGNGMSHLTNFLGVFLDNARDLIPIPLPTEEALLKRWNPVVKDAHAVGLTAVHDALLGQDMIDFFHK